MNDTIKIDDIIKAYEGEIIPPANIGRPEPELETRKAAPKSDTLRKYVLYDKYLAKTGNKKHSAIKAGFTEATAHNARVNIENSLTYKQYRQTLIKNLNKLMPAHKMAELIASKAQFAGKEVATRDGIVFLQDDSISHKYLNTALELTAQHQDSKEKQPQVNINFNSLIQEANN